MLRRGVLLLALVGLLPTAAARATPLLPVARGHFQVLLGESDEWQPEAGIAETVTLIGGPARVRDTRGLNAYLSLQRRDKPCGRYPVSAGPTVLTVPDFYTPTHRVRAGSPLAVKGGASAGVFAAALDAGVLHERGAVRACIWLATTPDAPKPPPKKKSHHRVKLKPVRIPHFSQVIPLLNGLVAASVFSLGQGYALDAGSVGTPFDYSVDSAVCGTITHGRRVRVPADQQVSASVAVSSLNCSGDGSQFSVFKASGAPLGNVVYTDADAALSPPMVSHLGGCELSGVSGLTLSAAEQYVTAVGCRTGRVLTAPFDGSVGRGDVTEAQVDGGDAPLAPAKTTVDLVVDG